MSAADHFQLKKSSQLEYLQNRKNHKNSNFSMLKWSAHKKRMIFTISLSFLYLILQISIFLPDFRQLRLKCTDWSDVACTMLLWQGDALSDLPKEEEIELTVVISYCGEEMDIFNKYIDDNSANANLKSITIISRCPVKFPKYLSHNVTVTTLKSKLQYPRLNFIEWLTEHVKSAASQSLPDYFFQENHMLLFLSADSIKDDNDSRMQVRKLDEILQSAKERNFGCSKRLPTQMSYYHDAYILRKYSNPYPSQRRYYINFGKWIDHYDLSWILENDLVPVCYSSSFAIKSKYLSENPDIFYPALSKMLRDYKKHGHRELVEFMDRSWAGLFSDKLSLADRQALRKYSTNVHADPHFTGALHHNLRWHKWFKVFTGDTIKKEPINLSLFRFTLVISHCDEYMYWMQKYFKDIPLQNVFIYSKCNNETIGYTPPGAITIRLPNVGRCDHSYAHWMANYMKKEEAVENHIVLFFKASRYLYQEGMRYRSLGDVARIAKEHGFSCEAEPLDKSYYYHLDLLRNFSIKEHRGVNVSSSYANMSQYLDEVGIELPNISPVCFGGNFAAKATQIFPRKNLWSNISTSLERGNNIEEGHFMERAWAGILSNPLGSNDAVVLQRIPMKRGNNETTLVSFPGYMPLNV